MPYESLLVRSGFPGPAVHNIMYQYLKDRPLRQVNKELRKLHKLLASERIGLVTGVRKQESQRRMAKAYYDTTQDGSLVWIAPIQDWTKRDVMDYVMPRLEAAGAPRNLVADTLHGSKECMCGAFAKPDERAAIKFWYPAAYERILVWERLVEVARLCRPDEIDSQHCQWGWGNGIAAEQLELIPFRMCVHCEATRPEKKNR